MTADAARMMVIKSLRDRIEEHDMALPAVALAECRERMREDGWRYDQARTLGDGAEDGRRFAGLCGIDGTIGEQVFSPCRADLVIETLRNFIADNRIGQTRKGIR